MSRLDFVALLQYVAPCVRLTRCYCLLRQRGMGQDGIVEFRNRLHICGTGCRGGSTFDILTL